MKNKKALVEAILAGNRLIERQLIETEGWTRSEIMSVLEEIADDATTRLCKLGNCMSLESLDEYAGGIISKIAEGIRKDAGSNYIVDYTLDKYDDVISLTGPVLRKSNLFGNAYYFGYRFNNTASSKDRSDFIKALKGYSDKALSESDLQQLISKPLADLDNQIGLRSVDALVYPVSKLNSLVRQIVRVTNRMLPHNIGYATFEIVKNIPSEITFDYAKFAADRGGEDSQSYIDSLPYIHNMLDKIHSLDYFSIARDAKPKYRPYFMNYLKLDNSSHTAALSKLSSANRILVIDDINTSGSTISEILRIIRNINISANIFVYTLIGKE